MNLKTIEFEGLKSYKRRTRLDFSNYDGVVYITSTNLDVPGMDGNAGGKTTILDAISWILYGKMPETATRDRDSVINHQSQRVWGLLELDGCRAERWMERGKTMEFRFRCDGDASWTQKKLGQTQADFEEKVIGISFEAFCNAVYLSPYSPVASLLRMKPSQRVEAVQEMVEYKAFQAAGKIAADKVKEIDRTCAALTVNLNRWEEMEARCAAELEQVEAEANRDKKMREERAQKVALEIADCHTQIARLQTSLGAPVVVDTKDLETRVVATQSRLNHIERSIGEQQYAANLQHLKPGHTCPTCKRVVTAKDAVELEIQQRTAKTTLQQLNDQKAKDQHILSELRDTLARYQSYEAEKGKVQIQIGALHERILSLQDQVIPAQDVYLAKRIETLVKELHDLRTNIVDARNSIVREKVDYEVYKDWAYAYGKELRDMLFDQVREGLAFRSNLEYKELFWNDEYRMDCSPVEGEDKFEINIYRGKHKQDIRDFSGGEGIRLRLGTMLASRQLIFSRKVCPFTFLLIDEYGEGLDSKGREVVDEILREKVKEGQFSLVLVTLPHKDIGDGRPGIHVTMKGKESILTE